MDIWTKEKRSEVMSRIRSKDTKPEIALRSLLFGMGYRFRIHDKRLPGKPDIVMRKHRVVIFMHGCFWHNHQACGAGKTPKSNRKFWKQKLTRTVERDEQRRLELIQLGWNVITVWECEVNQMLKGRNDLLQDLVQEITKNKAEGEIR